MSTQVKIVMAAINIACLIVTLLSPADITPFVLLTTIASTASWAFTTQEKTKEGHKGLLIYTGLASFLAVVCIVLGVTSSIAEMCPNQAPGLYIITFDDSLAFLAGKSFDFIWFAIPIFVFIVFLMCVEVISSHVKEKAYNNKESKAVPLAKTIKQKLKSLTNT